MADEDRRFCRHISKVVKHGCAFVGVNLEYCRDDDKEDAGDAEGADDPDADADDEWKMLVMKTNQALEEEFHSFVFKH